MWLKRRDSLLTEHMAKTTCDWCKKEMDGGFMGTKRYCSPKCEKEANS
jgi:hypothetical protein